MFPFLSNNIVSENSEDIVTFYLEYESETNPQKIDNDCILLVEAVSKIDGIDFVLSNAQKGRAEFEAGFNPKKTSFNKIVKVLPLFTSLCTEISPPKISITFFTSARPSPLPWVECEVSP